MLEKLSAEDFKPMVDTYFNAAGPGNPSCRLKLTDVETHTFEPEHDFPGKKREAFSLIFVAPENLIERQGTVELSHPEFDESMAVFMVALEKLKDPPGCIRCQVAFN